MLTHQGKDPDLKKKVEVLIFELNEICITLLGTLIAFLRYKEKAIRGSSAFDLTRKILGYKPKHPYTPHTVTFLDAPYNIVILHFFCSVLANAIDPLHYILYVIVAFGFDYSVPYE